MHGRVSGGFGYVADWRHPLPVEQRQGDRRERHRPPPRQPQSQHRPSGERTQAGHVPAHRVRHREGGEGGDRVDRHPPAQHALGGRQQQQGSGGEQGHPDEGREDEWLLAAGGKRERQRAERTERRKCDQRAPAPISGQHHGDARERQKEAGNRAAANRERGEPGGKHEMASLEGEQCPQTDRDPQREGEAAGEQHRRGARPEPKGRKARAVAVTMTGEGAEQPGSRHRGQGANQPRPEGGSERREEDAVAGQVVAPVPVVVPEQEAVRGEQVGAKRLRRMIGAGGLQDQVRDREDGGHEHAGG